jgi:hypothetical protein
MWHMSHEKIKRMALDRNKSYCDHVYSMSFTAEYAACADCEQLWVMTGGGWKPENKDGCYYTYKKKAYKKNFYKKKKY